MRLIDADKLKLETLEIKRIMAEEHKIPLSKTILDCLLNIISLQPTVEERPKGEWVYRQHGKNVEMCCSVCDNIRYTCVAYNYTIEEVRKGLDKERFNNFCPNCGADMQRRQTNETN